MLRVLGNNLLWFLEANRLALEAGSDLGVYMFVDYRPL